MSETINESCPTCGQRIRHNIPTTKAERVGGLHYLGRQVYTLSDRPGLWSSKPPQVPQGPSTQAAQCIGKGPGINSFWRLTELEAKITAAERQGETKE